MATMTSPADPLTELCKSIGPVSRTLHLAYIPQTHSLPAREDSGFIQALHILPHDVRGLGALFTALFWCDSRSPCRAGSHVSVPSQKVVVQTPLSGRHSPGSGQRTREPRSGDHKRRACSGGPAGRPEDPSPQPPRKRRREMPTSGKPAADGGGGGDTEWKAKWRRQRWSGAEGRARSSRPRVGPRWLAAAPRRVSPPCPIPNPERR